MVFFKGTAHPAPSKSRAHPADLSSAEIQNIKGSLGGKPLLLEHDPSNHIGSVLTSWEGRRGELRVSGHIDDPDIASKVRSGELRGLSLGTGMVQTDDSQVLFRNQDELSVCSEGRRPGTWIDTVDGKAVHSTYNASKSDSLGTAPACRYLHNPPQTR